MHIGRKKINPSSFIHSIINCIGHLKEYIFLFLNPIFVTSNNKKITSQNTQPIYKSHLLFLDSDEYLKNGKHAHS